jgi:hypothetical protein
MYFQRIYRRFRGVPFQSSGRSLMIEIVRASETSVNFNETTRCYIPEDPNLRLLGCFTMYFHRNLHTFQRCVLRQSSGRSLMMEAVGTSETSINFYETARRNIQEDSPPPSKEVYLSKYLHTHDCSTFWESVSLLVVSGPLSLYAAQYRCEIEYQTSNVRKQDAEKKKLVI